MSIDLAKRSFFARRTAVLTSIKMLCLGVIVMRFGYLQTFLGSKYKQLAKFNSLKLSFKPAKRGNIIDRNGTLMVTTSEYITIIFSNVPLNNSGIEVIRRLYNTIYSNDTHKAEVNLKAAIRYSKNNPSLNIPLYKCNVNDDLEIINKVSFFLPTLPGVEVKNIAGRFYPFKESAAHIIGYVRQASKKMLDSANSVITKQMYRSPDFQIGAFGIEASENNWLVGEPKIYGINVNNTGNIVNKNIIQKGCDGNDIKLTIDCRIQNHLASLLREKSGGCVVLDIENGDILAMHSSPAFDPSIFSAWGNAQMTRDALFNQGNVMFNRCISGLYPPGSTFKPITAATAVSSGWNPNTKIKCNGSFKYGNRLFHCWKKEGHGIVDLETAIAQSCNVYFYNIGAEMDIDYLHNCASEFGLGENFNLGIGKESIGCVPSRAWKKKVIGQPWVGGETINSVIGQGYNQVNILQLAVAAARIAANGKTITPYLWSDFIKVNNLDVAPYHSLVRATINNPIFLTQEAIKIAQNGMRACVNSSDGALRRFGAQYPDAKIAGKTGTAQTVSRRIEADAMRKDDANAAHGLFFGYAPYDNPRFATAVVVEKGIWGSISAGPVGMEILSFCTKL